MALNKIDTSFLSEIKGVPVKRTHRIKAEKIKGCKPKAVLSNGHEGEMALAVGRISLL